MRAPSVSRQSPAERAAEYQAAATALLAAAADVDRIADIAAAIDDAAKSVSAATKAVSRAQGQLRTARQALADRRAELVAAVRVHIDGGLPASDAAAVFGVAESIVAAARRDTPTATAAVTASPPLPDDLDDSYTGGVV